MLADFPCSANARAASIAPVAELAGTEAVETVVSVFMAGVALFPVKGVIESK